MTHVNEIHVSTETVSDEAFYLSTYKVNPLKQLRNEPWMINGKFESPPKVLRAVRPVGKDIH